MRVLLVILFFSSLSYGQTPNSWEKIGDFAGLKRTRAVGVGIGDYGYVGTGEDTTEVTHQDWWQYDPTSDSWSQMTDVPGGPRKKRGCLCY